VPHVPCSWVGWAVASSLAIRFSLRAFSWHPAVHCYTTDAGHE
jgi:hypothetical protein